MLYTAAIAAINASVGTVIPLLVMVIRRGVLIEHMYLGEGLVHLLRSMLSLLEMLSWSFRWISLSLRISCNSTAGHILLCVLCDMLQPMYTCRYSRSIYMIHDT